MWGTRPWTQHRKYINILTPLRLLLRFKLNLFGNKQELLKLLRCGIWMPWRTSSSWEQAEHDKTSTSTGNQDVGCSFKLPKCRLNIVLCDCGHERSEGERELQNMSFEDCAYTVTNDALHRIAESVNFDPPVFSSHILASSMEEANYLTLAQSPVWSTFYKHDIFVFQSTLI